MATQYNAEAFKNTDVSFVITLDESAAGWTLAWKLAASVGGSPLISKTTVSGIAVSTVTVTVTIAAADLALTPGTYYYDLARTDSGSKAVLTYGTFTVLGTTALS